MLFKEYEDKIVDIGDSYYDQLEQVDSKEKIVRILAAILWQCNRSDSSDNPGLHLQACNEDGEMGTYGHVRRALQSLGVDMDRWADCNEIRYV